ncbi:MAG: FmdB family zinc ribbon protein [Gemmatimonadaceae bacterium]
MPTYEFACPNGHNFDKFYRKMSDSVSELPCPVCGAVALRKVSGGAGLVFKGSGFYITDYGKDGKKGQPSQPRDSGDGGSADSAGTKSGTESGEKASSSDAKPDAKPAAPPKDSSST